MSVEYKYNIKDNVVILSNKKYINKVVCERVNDGLINYYLLSSNYDDSLLYEPFVPYTEEKYIISIKEYRRLKLKKLNNKNLINKIINFFHK